MSQALSRMYSSLPSILGGTRPQALGARAEPQATSWVGPAHKHLTWNEHNRFDLEDFIGYLINDGKSYTLYAGDDILFIRNLLPDTGNGSLKILRNSAAEALKLHHDKNPALGGPGCFGVMV